MSEYILSHLRSPQMCIKEKQQMLVAPLVGAMAHRELTVSLPQPDPVAGECRGSFARCRRSPGEASLLVFLWGRSSADAFVPATRSCVLKSPVWGWNSRSRAASEGCPEKCCDSLSLRHFSAVPAGQPVMGSFGV